MMKTRTFLLGALAIAAVTTAGLVACKKSISDKKSDRALTAGITAACDCATYTSDSTISGNISANLHLVATTRYKLNGLVFVINGATVTIDAGTRIEGIKGAPGGGLVVTRGSKLVAVGTAHCPIVFTSDQTSPVSGDWSGVILLGKAQTNNAGAFVEGINNTAFPGIDLQYGSTDSIVGGVNVNNDTSGILKYVRIEYAGFALSLNNEINGLTLAGVGRGTTLDYIEVFKSNDDAFEFFGGTVNASHLISVDALDDMFDTDNGYNGSISFALGMADTSRKDQSQSNGFESDDNATGTVVAGAPVTDPHYSNVTIVGVDSVRASSQPSVGGLTVRYGRGGHFRRASRFHIRNTIVFGYNYGISMDNQLGGADSVEHHFNIGNSVLTNVYAAGYGKPSPAGVGPWAVEINGVAATGVNFVRSFNPNNTWSSGNVGFLGNASPSPNPFNLANPFSRSDISNFFVNFGEDAFSYGAFPDGEDWTIDSNGCTSVWVKLH